MNTTEEFKKHINIVESFRSHVLMLVGLYGPSGGGKSVTAVKWAVGMVGPDQQIGIVDTEQHRSGFAIDAAEDMALKHYSKPMRKPLAAYLEAPFHPLKYVAAIQSLVAAGCRAIVVDSMSHAWSGDGGYLDLKEAELDRMAGDDFGKREKCAMAAAARLKPKTHGKLLDAIVHCPVPAILCFRSKEKTRMERRDGKTVISQDLFATPIQEHDLIYEMLISGEVTAKNGIGGYCSFQGAPGECKKHTHPSILSLLPKPDEQFDFNHAEALALWCSNPKRTTKPAAACATEKTRDWMISQLQPFKDKALAYAIDKAILMPTEGLEDWPLEKVPTTKPALHSLMAEIEAHQ